MISGGCSWYKWGESEENKSAQTLKREDKSLILPRDSVFAAASILASNQIIALRLDI
jgi:hypothetical protein